MKRSRILLLDRGPGSDLGDALAEILTEPGSRSFELIRERGGARELPRRAEQSSADAVVVVHDGRWQGLDPTALPVVDQPVLAVLPSARPRRLIDLLSRGYTDFILAPLSREQVVPRLWRCLGHARRRRDSVQRVKERVGLKRLIGRSPAFLAQTEKIPVVAPCDAGVLLTGDTGTGKEVFARTIHYLSPRCQRPFVPVNCGAIPLELVENELFGHARAAFTGADSARPGLIEEADGGTLFLDEIDSLPLAAQVKLLRFLQEKEARRLGSARTRQFDVRVIAATNARVEAALDEGRLRRDLYYRINVIAFHLPRLKDRVEDIPLLAQHFLERAACEFDRPLEGFSQGAMARLLEHDWPGNVRELEHIVQRAVVISQDGERVRRRDVDLPGAGDADSAESFREAKARIVASFEKRYVEKMLAAHRGNISHAAAAAKKNRRAFWELIRKHRVDAGRFRSRSERAPGLARGAQGA